VSADRRLRNRSKHATFLAYHSVAPEGPTYLTVSAELFERQLDTLSERGLKCGDLRTLEAIAAGRPVPPSVFLTFDDGFLDNYETVLPLLRQRGMQAFVFVLPPSVEFGSRLLWPEVAEDAARYPATMRSVDWAMLEEMRAGPFEVGSHTLTHPHLPDLDDVALRRELAESRAWVKDRLGSCDTLAYPFGEWSPRVAAAAAECGYRFAFSLPTTHGQWAAGPLSIPRVNVDYRDSGRRLSAKLSPSGRRLYLSEAVKAPRRQAKALRARGRTD
jgi:peptidoglycan/xylan/chitin deacetylase (PgdA/CDA1 family)